MVPTSSCSASNTIYVMTAPLHHLTQSLQCYLLGLGLEAFITANYMSFNTHITTTWGTAVQLQPTSGE